MLADQELVDGRRSLSGKLTYAASVEQAEEAALIDDIQNAEKIPRLITGEDNGSKDSQEIETGTG